MRAIVSKILSVIVFSLAGAFGIVAAAFGLVSIGILFSPDYDVDVGGGVSQAELGIRTLTAIVGFAITAGAVIAASFLVNLAKYTYHRQGTRVGVSNRDWAIATGLASIPILLASLFFSFDEFFIGKIQDYTGEEGDNQTVIQSGIRATSRPSS